MQHKSIVSFIHSAVEIIFAKTGNSLNVVQSHGYTTLHIAAVNGHHEVAKIILTKVTKKIYRFSPVFFLFLLVCKTSWVVKPLQQIWKSVDYVQSRYGIWLAACGSLGYSALLLLLFSNCKNKEKKLSFTFTVSSLRKIDCYRAYVKVLRWSSGSPPNWYPCFPLVIKQIFSVWDTTPSLHTPCNAVRMSSPWQRKGLRKVSCFRTQHSDPGRSQR